MFPRPSMKSRPEAENTLGKESPFMSDPIDVLLPETLEPGGVTAIGMRGPEPLGELEPGGVAPSRKKLSRVPTKPYAPTISPLPEQVRACDSGARNDIHKTATTPAGKY